MKVLLINGSPKPKGCTFTALSIIAKELSEQGIESEIFNIGTTPIIGCIACKQCHKNNLGKCIFDNDVTNKCIELAEQADGIIVGSPVYFAGPNSALCAMLDRMFFSANAKFNFKPAAAIASARRAGTTATIDRINKYFSFANMPIVSSMYWNEIHGNTPEEAMQDEEGVQIMRTLGRNMAWMLKNIEAGKEKGIEQPTPEARTMTNFIR